MKNLANDNIGYGPCRYCYNWKAPIDLETDTFLPHKTAGYSKEHDCENVGKECANYFCKYCGDIRQYEYPDNTSAICDSCHEAEKRIGRDDLMYVNAYLVGRQYGGSEEGGWWYDTHTPIASIPVKAKWHAGHAYGCYACDNGNICKGESHLVLIDPDKADEFKNYLLKIYEPIYGGQRSRFSVIGGDDLCVYIEDHPAEYSPKETPRYE